MKYCLAFRKTSFSSIRVRVPGGVGYNVTARTSFGRVSSELPVTATGTMGGDTLNGKIGSGGCQLLLTDSNGSIEILKSSLIARNISFCRNAHDP